MGWVKGSGLGSDGAMERWSEGKGDEGGDIDATIVLVDPGCSRESQSEAG